MPQMFIESVIALRIYSIASAIFFVALARNCGTANGIVDGPRNRWMSFAHALGGTLPNLYWMATRGCNIRSSRGVTIRPKLVKGLIALVIVLVGALFGELVTTNIALDIHPAPEFHKQYALETLLLIFHALFFIRILTHDDAPPRKRKQKCATKNE